MHVPMETLAGHGSQSSSDSNSDGSKCNSDSSSEAMQFGEGLPADEAAFGAAFDCPSGGFAGHDAAPLAEGEELRAGFMSRAMFCWVLPMLRRGVGEALVPSSCARRMPRAN